MTGVTRFPHYHQAENVVTNHVMVMLRLLYDVSPKLLEALLQALCAGEVTVGPRFSQQIFGTYSVPDGLVSQEPFAVFVETKLSSAINVDQLQRHCRTIVDRLPGRKGSFLISLTSGQSGQAIPGEVAKMAQEHGITVVPATFGELVSQIAELPVTDLVLRDTLQEFTDFIFAQGLVPRQQQFMVATLTGVSWRENVQYGVYYEPIDRNAKWQRAAFLGLYHDKQVSHIGRIIIAVPVMRDETGEMAFDTPELGTLVETHRKAIVGVIAAAQKYYPDLEDGKHRYYVVDAFTQLDFRKTSPGGMMGHRYFDIEQIGGKRLLSSASGLEAAQTLSGHSFS